MANPGAFPIKDGSYPANNANDLYNQMTTTYSGARQISDVESVLTGFTGGSEYEAIENARLLDPNSEYIYDKQLGYLSLNMSLQEGQMLAVAFEYEYSDASGKRTGRVGEFSDSNPTNPSNCLYVKLLRGTNMSPP